MTEIEYRTGLVLLQQLFENGAMTEQELEDFIGVDQIDSNDIAAWCEAMEKDSLIEELPSGATRRWVITDVGRKAIGVPNTR